MKLARHPPAQLNGFVLRWHVSSWWTQASLLKPLQKNVVFQVRKSCVEASRACYQHLLENIAGIGQTHNRTVMTWIHRIRCGRDKHGFPAKRDHVNWSVCRATRYQRQITPNNAVHHSVALLKTRRARFKHGSILGSDSDLLLSWREILMIHSRISSYNGGFRWRASRRLALQLMKLRLSRTVFEFGCDHATPQQFVWTTRRCRQIDAAD